MKKFLSAAIIAGSMGAPAVLAEPPVVVPIAQGAAGKGGIDAFEAAGKAFADPKNKMKALSGSDYELVQKGEKELSNAPRASKRRALQMCKDGAARKNVPTGKRGMFGEEVMNEKDCINRVMDGDYKFILDKNTPNKK